MRLRYMEITGIPLKGLNADLLSDTLTQPKLQHGAVVGGVAAT